ASMATMPVFSFSFEGSKMIGSMITGITFSSALMHSGRRAEVSVKDNVCPTGIFSKKKAYKIYEEAANGNVNAFNQMLKLGAVRDEASKILHYGTYGTGVLSFPAESLVTFSHEYELEREWMPEEAGMLIELLEKKMKKMGIDFLYATRSVAPRNTYAYPNLFKDPGEGNLARDLAQANKLDKDMTKIVSFESYLGQGFKKRVLEFIKIRKGIVRDNKTLKKRWPELLGLRRKLIRDYGTGLNISFLSRVSWRVWRDKKRHRTAPVVTESIYYCASRASRVIGCHRKDWERRGDLSVEAIEEINRVLAVPPVLRQDQKLRQIYLKACFDSFLAYERMLELGIEPRDAIFVIPRAIRIDMIQQYNLHNLIEGYYPLRSCVTADEQILRQTREEIRQIKKLFSARGLGYLNNLIEPKCTGSGFCPEEKTCGYIKGMVKGYNDKGHGEMKDDLEQRFLDKLKRLGK
ncbi:FAD-dependent thymidylate synthase, partial [Patescibacteria group bacterium]|nr:FAD-dependent thymidylate synthase [Patescibacteria group bacterium]